VGAWVYAIAYFPWRRQKKLPRAELELGGQCRLANFLHYFGHYVKISLVS